MKLLLLLGALLLTIARQDSTPLVYGQLVTGQINANTPSLVYSFEALRCDFVSIRLTVTGGDLDPIMTVIDNQSETLLVQDDSEGRLDILVEPLAIPASGVYQIVVGRFGYRQGSTSGTFELVVDRIGNGSVHGCALRYGDTVYNAITDRQSQFIYSFQARRGDIINLRMERRTGDLDSYLSVTDNAGFVLEYSDDALGAGTDAAITGLIIPADGTYYIFATRYGLESGRSAGNFLLNLEEATESGMGNAPVNAIPLRYGTVVEGELDNASYQRYYRFEARQNDIVTIAMSRLSNNIDTFIALTDSNLQELAEDDDGGEGQNSLLDSYRIPADGTYYIIATRYERADGTTSGRFRLELDSQGNAFASVPPEIRRVSYGTTITGSIDEVTPEILYAFYGQEGDEITVSMNRGDGDLDPFVSILDADRVTPLVRNDDSSTNQNALIQRFTLPRTGVYYIRAARFEGETNPDTSGSFVLVLAEVIDDAG